MSGMEKMEWNEQLGYDDSYRSTEESRQRYLVLFNLNAKLGKWVNLKSSFICLLDPKYALFEAVVDLTTEVIARASYRSAIEVEQNRALARYLVGLPKEPPALPPKDHK